MSTIKVITREAYDHLAEQCEALQVKLARREALLRECLERGFGTWDPLEKHPYLEERIQEELGE